MTEERIDTAEARIDAKLAGRIDDITELHKIVDDDEGMIDGEEVDADDAYDRLNSLALDVRVKHTMTVLLSTGDPGDQLEIAIEKGKYGWELADDEATYRFLDWFDGATRRTRDVDVMRFLEGLIGGMDL